MSKKIIISILILMGILIGIFLVSQKSASKEQNIISKSQEEKEGKKDKEGEEEEEGREENVEARYPISPISGIASVNGDRRPFAAMLAADEGVRPISGIGQADLVIEMPVIKGGINRFMAVFVTEDPAEIGSVRSARHDFIPLARGLNAIYAHWGGSHFALDKLNMHVVDNIDALTNPFGAYYRKSGMQAPDNGFTNIERLINSAEKLGYETKNKQVVKNIISDEDWSPEAGGWAYLGEDISIDYPGKFSVKWEFDGKNTYYRFRGGSPEIDKNTDEQVSARVVALLAVKSRHLEGQYNDVDIEGSGPLKIYQDGFVIEGKWSKDKNNQESPMRFIDKNGYEIQLSAGRRWWEIYDE